MNLIFNCFAEKANAGDAIEVGQFSDDEAGDEPFWKSEEKKKLPKSANFWGSSDKKFARDTQTHHVIAGGVDIG